MTPLLELSGRADPNLIAHPRARQAILDVVAGLRKLSLGKRLWPTPSQIIGLAYCAIAHDRVLVADEQGLGKSILSMCRIVLSNHFPAIVICTSSSLGDWKTEFWGKWFPAIPVHVVDRIDASVPLNGWPGVVLVTWDLLRYHVAALQALRPRIVVSDECHYVTYSEESERSLAHRIVTQGVPHLLLMSGTPIKNNAIELWRLLCLIDRRWESKEEAFKAANRDVLDEDTGPLARSVRQFMLRRTKAVAMRDLPPKKYTTLDVDLDEAALAEYRKAESDFRTWVRVELRKRVRREMEGLDEDDPSVLAVVEERVQRSLAAESLVRVGYLRRLVGIAKAPAAVAWIKDMYATGEPVVVFAEHQETVHLIEAGLKAARIEYALVDGGTTRSNREKAKRAFRSGTVSVFLASQAAKEGITLTRARHLLFVERWWTPAAEDQAADRIHRMTQLRAVTIWILRVRKTIDVRMAEINVRKRKISARVVEERLPAMSTTTRAYPAR